MSPAPATLMAVLLASAVSGAQASTESMAAHCRQMPQMPGCEPYLAVGTRALPALTTALPGEGMVAPKPAVATPAVTLEDGDHYRLRAEVVSATLAGAPLRLYAYNGSVPGPLLKVRQGTTVTIDFENAIDQESTVHWHGLRLDWRHDGAPDISQAPVPPGGTHRYLLRFPDEGMYWYHPHVREDFQQDAGLYGNIWVLPEDPQHYAPVDRELALILDDLLIEDGVQVPYGKYAASHALMGRFGNLLLINGKPDWRLDAGVGETARLYLTNAANARVFNLSLPGLRMKRVGGDSGRYEREEWVDELLLAPSERAIVELAFDRPGDYPLRHSTPAGSRELGEIRVAGSSPAIAAIAADALRATPLVQAEIAALAPVLESAPALILTMDVDLGGYAAAQHPSPEPGRLDSGAHAGHGTAGNAVPPIEWEDTMGTINAAASSERIRWLLRDSASGAENAQVHWKLRQGEPVKIRLTNPATGQHPMQHPIHFHGQRFVVAAVDGVAASNRVWKDTVLVPAGASVDIVLDPSNPGEWMAHCHIAEHLSSGMMIRFRVEAAS